MAFEAYKAYRAPRWEDFPDIELYMDQVICVLEKHLSLFASEGEKVITSTMINNYVKQKLIPPPENKRYGRRQLAFLYVVCILKKFMQLSRIRILLENLKAGRTEEEAYLYFARQLDSVMQLVFERVLPEAEEARNPAEDCIRSAAAAFAVIVYSEAVFAEAEKDWVSAQKKAEEKIKKAEAKEKQKKEKEKAEMKEKQKKEKKKNPKEEK